MSNKIGVKECKSAGNSCVMVSFPAVGSKMVVDAILNCQPLVSTAQLHESAVFIAVCSLIKGKILDGPQSMKKYASTHFAAHIGGGFASISIITKSSKSAVLRVLKSMFKALSAGKVASKYKECVRKVGEKPSVDYCKKVYHDICRSIRECSVLFCGHKVGSINDKDMSKLRESLKSAFDRLPSDKLNVPAPQVTVTPSDVKHSSLSLGGDGRKLAGFMTMSYMEQISGVKFVYEGDKLCVYKSKEDLDKIDRKKHKADYAAKIVKQFSPNNTGIPLLVYYAASQAVGHAESLASTPDTLSVNLLV